VTRQRVVLALVVLVLAAGGVLVWLLRTGAGTEPTVTSAASADAGVASESVKTQVREAAGKAAEAAYGYTWQTVAVDKAAARDLMTSEMQRRYDRTTAGVVTSSQEDHAVVTAEVVGTALVTASTTHARVLVFVDQRTTGDDLDKPLLDLNRVLVTLERDDGDWLVSELDAL
jgi:hypothetical protein